MNELIYQVRSLLHEIDWHPNASDTEIMNAVDWEGLRQAYQASTSSPDLEPTHYNCCHAPKDQGHMFGCPNSTENEPDKKYRVVSFVHVPCDPSEFESMTLDEAKAELEHQSMMQPENRYEIQPVPTEVTDE